MAEKKTGKKSDRREQILKAALDIFSRKGYAAATMPEIARAAGVAAGTIYIYYPSKRELFVAVIKNLVISTPLLNLIEKLPDDRNNDIDTTVRRILQDRFDLSRHQAFARMPSLMGEVQRDPELKAIWNEKFLQPFMTQMDGIFRMMMASGKVRSMEPAVITRAVGGLIIGFLILKIMEGEASPVNRFSQEEVADELMRFVFYGLSTERIDNKDKENTP
ncbi:MAG: TetR/AcrR family transcriptional regulator [Dehalococcoidia bacterium]|jgi:AcrR family transcriptional regulator